MSIFGGIGKAIHSPDFGMRLQAALATAGGDQNAIYRMQEMQRQRAELQLRQQAAQRAEQDRADQVWGLKELGRSNPEIAAMNAGDASTATLQQIAPYTLSPGQTRNSGGANGTTTTAPTEMQQNISGLNAIDPRLGRGYANREAYGAPQAIAPGGGLAQPGDDGSYHWAVSPNMSDGTQAAPTAPGSPSGGSRNNPGGLRVPGSTQFRTFPTQAAGIAAQEQQLGRPQYLGTPHSISQIVERYAPRRSRGGDNTDAQVNNYISYVSQRLGVDPNQPLSAADIPRVGQAMREVETGRHGRGVIGATQGNGQAAALRAEAQRAIAAGADPAAVNARLRQMGVN